jgi:dienelactone hydrolase
MQRRFLLLILGLFASSVFGSEPESLAGPYDVGYRNVTIERPDTSTFSAWVFYPASNAERDAPPLADAGPFPAMSFGHGFLQPPQRYRFTLRFIASHGYIVIATNSHRGIAPDHAQYSQDLAQCLEHLIVRSSDESSWLAGLVDENALALSGHSMGGGAAVVASELINVQALIPLAGAPLRAKNSADADTEHHAAQLHIVGSEDRIVPPAASRTLIDEDSSPRLFATIEGGSHCGFMDETILGCDKGSIDQQTQLRITRSLMLAFLDFYLKDDDTMHEQVWVEHEDEAAGLVSMERKSEIDQ